MQGSSNLNIVNYLLKFIFLPLTFCPSFVERKLLIFFFFDLTMNLWSILCFLYASISTNIFFVSNGGKCVYLV